MLIKIATNKKQFDLFVKDPFLHSVHSIDEETLLMKFNSKRIHLDYPLYCGWAVLEKSKTIMYDMFYNHIKKAYGENTKLMYSDTDSFILKLDGFHSFLDRINHPCLQGFVDTSNFPKDHPNFSVACKGKLGAIKSETGVSLISEFVGLSPKCYSLLMADNSRKCTAKGINRNQQQR